MNALTILPAMLLSAAIGIEAGHAVGDRNSATNLTLSAGEGGVCYCAVGGYPTGGGGPQPTITPLPGVQGQCQYNWFGFCINPDKPCKRKASVAFGFSVYRKDQGCTASTSPFVESSEKPCGQSGNVYHYYALTESDCQEEEWYAYVYFYVTCGECGSGSDPH